MRILPSSNIKGQRATWWLCLLVWCQPILVGYLITAINKATGIPFVVFYNYLLPAIYIILALASFPYISRKLRASDWLFYFGFLAVYFGSYLLVPGNREYLGTLMTVLPFCMLPMYMLGVSFELEPLKKHFYVISIISILVQFIFFRVIVLTGVSQHVSSEADHHMHLSYQVLPYILFVIWYAFEKPNVVNLFFSIFGSVLMLILGTRGPFASILFFTLVYLVVFKLSHIGSFNKILILIGGVLLYLFFTTAVTALMDSISSLGGSNRVLGWILGVDEGSQLSNDARVDFAELAFQALKESNYMGLGFAGDRLFMEGFFVHNFFLECLVSYGIFFGVLIPTIILIRLIKAVIRDKESNKCRFMLIMVGLGIIPLLVSGSYVDDPWFYLMLGYCTQTLRMPKVNYYTN